MSQRELKILGKRPKFTRLGIEVVIDLLEEKGVFTKRWISEKTKGILEEVIKMTSKGF